MLLHHEYAAHILDRQREQEAAIQAAYAEGVYTPAQPLVRLNPYEIAPLTALVMFHTKAPMAVHLTVHGKTAAADFSVDFPPAAEHWLPIYGLYADQDNLVTYTLDNGDTYCLTIRTDAAPDKLKQPASVSCAPDYLSGELMFLSPTSPAFTAGYDAAGDCRWYCTLNLVFAFKRLANGHICVGTERLVAPPYNTTGLYEMSLLGKIYAEYRLPGGYHHDQTELPNGDLLVLTQDLSRDTVEDMCVLIDRTSGAVKKIWDYATLLPNGVGSVSKSPDGHDWFHNNSLWYDEATNSLTLSGRNEDIIINIDFVTGELNWILGDPALWPEEYVQKYFFTPVNDGIDFEWPYGQHSAMLLPDGDVFVFDNGCWRSKAAPQVYPGGSRYSRGVRYHLDHEKRQVTQVWQWGKELGEKYFAPNISNVDYYDDDYYLVHFGSNGFLHGQVCTKTPVSYSGEEAKAIIMDSITMEIKDGQIVYELHVPASFYRAKKLPLYTGQETVSLEPGRLLGQLALTPETRLKIRAQSSGLPVPSVYQLVILEEKDRICFNATFETGETVQVLLTDEAGTIHRYTYNTVPQRVLSMCVGTFQKDDPRNVDLVINKVGLQGDYQVQVIISDTLYETGITLTI